MNQIKEFFQWIIDSLKIWIIVQPWESAVRVRMGKNTKVLTKGIFFRIPYLDSVFVQENRLRIVQMSLQTLTTKDLNAITIEGAVGYTIKDIEKLYNTLYQPETTISNLVKSKIAEYIFERNHNEILPSELENSIMMDLQQLDYGIDIQYFRVQNFAIVKTFRLIQDQSWSSEGIRMSDKNNFPNGSRRRFDSAFGSKKLE